MMEKGSNKNIGQRGSMNRLYKRTLFTILMIALLTACNVRPPFSMNATPTPSEMPSFSHPTDINNPYDPVSLSTLAIYLGTKKGKPARNEVTLLPSTKVISWGGQQTRTDVMQFIAYVDGKLDETAYDYFAQADDGSVYYLGEDISHYINGIVNHEGSWRAGQDGASPQMMMPAQPRVGQRFNPKNLPGVVYESDEITSLSEKATTPAGSIEDGMLVEETLMDGSAEQKVYARHFGIVLDRGSDEVLKLILYRQTDAKPGIVPGALSTIENQAEDIFDIVPSSQWEQVDADVKAIGDAWQSYQAQAIKDRAPQPFQDALASAFDRLQKTSAAKDAAGVLQAANDVSAAVVDLSTVYNPVLPTDLGLLDVLGRQVGRDLAANDMLAVGDCLAKASAIWERLKPAILARNGAELAQQFDISLSAQQTALKKADTAALTTEANGYLELIDQLEGLF